MTFISCNNNRKDNVIIVEKKYNPAWVASGEISTDDEYLLYVKRKNSTSFFMGFKIMIVYTNEESFNRLKVGDILSDKY